MDTTPGAVIRVFVTYRGRSMHIEGTAVELDPGEKPDGVPGYGAPVDTEHQEVVIRVTDATVTWLRSFWDEEE